MACCKLHKLCSMEGFASKMHHELLERLFKHCVKKIDRQKRKTLIGNIVDYDDLDIYIYLFKGCSGRHLASISQRHFTLQSSLIVQKKIWYPVISLHHIEPTKSFSFLTKTMLPIGCLYVISYNEEFLNKYDLKYISTLDITMELTVINYMIYHSSNEQIIDVLSEAMGSRLKCNTEFELKPFITDDINLSTLRHEPKPYYNHIPYSMQPFSICHFAQEQPQAKAIEEEEPKADKWISPITHFLMTTNWTTSSKKSNEREKELYTMKIHTDPQISALQNIAANKFKPILPKTATNTLQSIHPNHSSMTMGTNLPSIRFIPLQPILPSTTSHVQQVYQTIYSLQSKISPMMMMKQPQKTTSMQTPFETTEANNQETTMLQPFQPPDQLIPNVTSLQQETMKTIVSENHLQITDTTPPYTLMTNTTMNLTSQD